MRFVIVVCSCALMSGCNIGAVDSLPSSNELEEDPTAVNSNDDTPSEPSTDTEPDTESGTKSVLTKELAASLGMPSRFLIGLGGTSQSEVENQGISIDIFERYLVGLDAGAWPTWNSPSGAYVNLVASQADALGAVPMFTLYQMADWGDGNISGLSDTAFMTSYWNQTKLMFERLAIYDKPALINFEPDLWGYVQIFGPSPDVTELEALVQLCSDCSDLPNTVAGMGNCLVRLARTYAPKALIGFPPASWMGDPTEEMIKVGMLDADFVVMQTSDRDAGCFETGTSEDACDREGANWYWDETNTTSPNFHDHFEKAKKYHESFEKPLIWWQTPLGVRSDTPGGTRNHYRDNRVHYFLSHAQELVDAGGLGAVFSAGADSQTDITTDEGQFATMSKAYMSAPVPLPE